MDSISTAIGAATFEQLDDIARGMWRSYGQGEIDDIQATQQRQNPKYLRALQCSMPDPRGVYGARGLDLLSRIASTAIVLPKGRGDSYR